MRRLIQRTLAAPVAIAVVCLLALPLTAFANTSGAIAQTGGMSVTLPMAGSGLSVVVVLDVVGNVSQVDLDPIGTYSATKLGPHAVTFENGDGTSQVKINAKHDKLEVKATAPTLASFLGTGSWSADLFGTHETTTVGYTVGAATDGTPTVVIASVAAPSDVAVVQETPKTRSGPKGSGASVRVDFSRDGFTKKLDIVVSVKADHEHAASLKISLSGKDKQKLSGALADLVGTRTWAGHTCDGTAIGFTYAVVADGTVVFGTASGATATSKPDEHGFKVTFDGTKTRVNVHLVQNGGTWELKVATRADQCRNTPAADPTVNTPVNLTPVKAHDHHDATHHAKHRNGGNQTGHNAVIKIHRG